MTTDLLADTAERFKRDTEHHELTILHEDGLYRHLRFRKPAGGYSEYWYDLITWPGVLVIRGDMETFAFSRTEDMIGFFRGQRVNPGYWGEKLIAPKSQDVRRYSEEKFRRMVADTAAEAEVDWPGVSAAVEAKFSGLFPDWDDSHEDAARAGLREFEFSAAGEPFKFADAWEWDLSDWSYQYLWCCHAIVFGISLYDQRKADAPKEQRDDAA